MKMLYAIALFISFLAMLFDLQSGKIPNVLVFSMLLASSVFRGVLEGGSAILPWVTGMALPLCLLYPAFHFRMIGAGDVKLLAALGSIGSAALSLKLLFFTFASGAILAILILSIRHLWRSRFSYFLGWCRRRPYSKDSLPYRTGKEGSAAMHLTIPIAIGTILTYGGMLL